LDPKPQTIKSDPNHPKNPNLSSRLEGGHVGLEIWICFHLGRTAHLGKRSEMVSPSPGHLMDAFYGKLG